MPVAVAGCFGLIRRILIKAERYEDAAKISKCIEDEYSNLKRKMENREQIIDPLK